MCDACMLHACCICGACVLQVRCMCVHMCVVCMVHECYMHVACMLHAWCVCAVCMLNVCSNIHSAAPPLHPALCSALAVDGACTPCGFSFQSARPMPWPRCQPDANERGTSPPRTRANPTNTTIWVRDGSCQCPPNGTNRRRQRV